MFPVGIPSRDEKHLPLAHPSHGPARSATPRPVAVAIGHEPEKDDRPKVIASGQGPIAEQILEIAFARGVRVREDAELAEILGVLDENSEIPLAAFAAVAEILAYVYRANGDPRQPPGASQQPQEAENERFL